MKTQKVILILLIILISILNLFSQTEYNKWQIVYKLDVMYEGGATSCIYLDIDSKNSKDIIAVANIHPDAPYAIKSTDSGYTWRIAMADKIGDGTYEPFKANVLCVAANDLAIIGCDSGSYWRSTDNGETWQNHFVENRMRIWEMGFWDNKVGLIFQSRGSNEALINKTTDGGLTWFESPKPKMISEMPMAYYLICKGDGIAYAIEVDNVDDFVYYFHKSTDYGETWSEVYPGPEVPPHGSFYFYNENLGFCYGEYGLGDHKEGKLIRRTSDGGRTWERVLVESMNNNPIKDIHFADSLNGIAASISNIFRTNDGGVTWYEDTTFNYKVNDPDIADVAYVYMVDKNNVIGLAYRLDNQVSRITYDDPLSVSGNYKVSRFDIFPNPAKTSLSIELEDNNLLGSEYSIFTIDGKEIQKGNTTQQIEISNLIRGNYYIIISSGDNIYYSKFIKE